MNYVSPSILPSRSANSVHVLNQCNALANTLTEVNLYFATMEQHVDHAVINKFYGGRLNQNVKLHPVYIRSQWALELKIALFALFHGKKISDAMTLSRNFYFSFILTVLRRNHLYEAHNIEKKKIKLWMQKLIVNDNKVVVISRKLADIFTSKFKNLTVPLVLHDAASSIQKVNIEKYIVDKNRFKVGYFGHLYKGRGIEIITEAAKCLDFIDFYVVGGDEASVAKLKSQNNVGNIHVLGFLPNIDARSLMTEVDILLMPYQKSVSIGLPNSDTSQWMSPLKMFEYMSSKKAIISSNLPVIKEVLTHNENALLVEPDCVDHWCNAIVELYASNSLRTKLATKAYNDYLNSYTWDARAASLIEYASRD